MFGDDRVRPFAYTYRDYVIRAFNQDLGFDRFVQEQLAADSVAPKDQPWRLAAMGFLTLGKMFDNNIHDQIDDRIDTVTRGFLGLTVACARCHDHKYDAIPTADYYSLYGVFASCEPPLELPLDRPAGRCIAPERLRDAGGRETQASSGSSSTISTSYSPMPRGSVRRITWSGPPPRPGPPRDGDLLPLPGPRGSSPADRGPVATLPQGSFPAGRSRFRPMARTDGAAGGQTRLGRRCHRGTLADPAAGHQARPVESAGCRALSHSLPKTRADVARAYGELIRRVDQEARKSAPSISAAPHR